MNAAVFEECFANSLLSTLPRDQPMVIIMDNAPYHSRMLDKPPTTAARKADIMKWLKDHGVPCSNDLKKTELLALVKMKKQPPTYAVDELAKQAGHRILRLPPYNCH